MNWNINFKIAILFLVISSCRSISWDDERLEAHFQGKKVSTFYKFLKTRGYKVESCLLKSSGMQGETWSGMKVLANKKDVLFKFQIRFEGFVIQRDSCYCRNDEEILEKEIQTIRVKQYRE